MTSTPREQTRRPAPRPTDEQVHSVTTAGRSLAQDQDYRAKQYFVLMGIRTLSFLVALVLAIVYPGWWALLFLFLAAVIPYVAVVLANAVNPHEGGEVTPVDAAALPPGRGPLLLGDGSVHHPDVDAPTEAADDLAPAPDVHVGEVVDVVDHGPVRTERPASAEQPAGPAHREEDAR